MRACRVKGCEGIWAGNCCLFELILNLHGYYTLTASIEAASISRQRCQPVPSSLESRLRKKRRGGLWPACRAGKSGANARSISACRLGESESLLGKD